MSYVVHLLAAFLSLSLAGLEWGPGTRFLPTLPLLFLLPHGLGLLAKRSLLHRRFRLGALLERALVVSPLAVQAIAVLALGWLEALEGRFGRELFLVGWPRLGLLAGLAPFLLAECLAIDARARLFGPERRVVAAARTFQLRLFASALVPFLIYLVACTLIGLRESWRVYVEEVALFGTSFTLFLLGLFVFLLPPLLRLTWDTSPLAPGLERAVLEDVARAARFRCRELLVWRTGNQVANAAIVGFFPRGRLVLFSDALLAQLSPRELAGVFAHEIGHARRHHALVFGLHTLGCLLAGQAFVRRLDAPKVALELAVFGALALLWYLSFGWLSRRIELEADLESLELLGEGEPLVRALVQVSGAHAHRRSSWRHFSTAQRLEFIARAEANPAVGRRLRLKLRFFGFAAALLFVCAAGFELIGVVGALDQERVVAELRLGRYEDAAALIERAESVDEDLVRLVQVAAALGPEARSPEALEQAAQQAARRGDLERAADLIELALLRGRTKLSPVAAYLSASSERDSELQELPGDWREILEDHSTR